MFRLIALAVVSVLATVCLLPLHADNCLTCRRAVVSVNVGHAAVQTHAVQTVVATPVFSTLVIPQAVRVEAFPPAYYSGAAGYRDSLVADAVAYRVLKAQAAERIVQQGSGPAALKAAAPAPIAPTAVPEKLAGIFGARCAACHSNGKNKVDFGDLSTTPTETRLRIFYYVMAGHMPIKPDGTVDPLPDEELQPIADWVGAAAAPNKVAKRGI